MDILLELKKMVLSELRKENVKLYLFGSWAKGLQRRTSDIDLAIDCEENRRDVIGRLREQLEESCFPYRVDVVDMREIGEGFAEKIRREGIVWKD